MEEHDIEEIEKDKEFIKWMEPFGPYWRRSSYSYISELQEAFIAGRESISNADGLQPQ